MTKKLLALTSCATVLYGAAFNTIADAQVTSLPINKCLAAKIKCVSGYAAAVAKCETKAAAKTGSVDSDCTGKAASKLTNGTNGCLERAIGLSDCTDAGTQATELNGSADSFLLDVVCTLDPGNASCDSTAPETIFTATPPSRTNDTTGDFQFQSPDPGATFDCAIDGGAFVACTSPLATSPLAEGFHFFQVRATDAAGNEDLTPATATWFIDLTPPDTILTQTEPDPSSDPVGHFSFTSSDTFAFFSCSVDGSPFASCTSPYLTPSLADGVHNFQVRAADVVGNVDPTPASYTWTITP